MLDVVSVFRKVKVKEEEKRDEGRGGRGEEKRRKERKEGGRGGEEEKEEGEKGTGKGEKGYVMTLSDGKLCYLVIESKNLLYQVICSLFHF